MITADQVKAARKLLEWSQVRLAGRSNVPESVISGIENGVLPKPLTRLAAIQETLESAGVEFTSGGESGVNLKAKPVVLSDDAAIGDSPERRDPEGRGDLYVGSEVVAR